MTNRPTVAELAARLDAMERDIAERLGAIEQAIAKLRGLRARDGLTADELRDQYETRRSAELAEVHGWLWAELGTVDGSPVVVEVRRVVEVLAAHGRFPGPSTVEQYLIQLSGLGLASYLGFTDEGRRQIRQWGLKAPRKTATATRPRR